MWGKEINDKDKFDPSSWPRVVWTETVAFISTIFTLSNSEWKGVSILFVKAFHWCLKLKLNCNINESELKHPAPCVSQAQVEAKKEHEGAVHLLEVSVWTRGGWLCVFMWLVLGDRGLLSPEADLCIPRAISCSFWPHYLNICAVFF